MRRDRIDWSKPPVAQSEKKILWVSRHEPLPKQVAALRHLFGEVEIVQDNRRFHNAEEVKQRFEEGRFTEMVIVAPLSVIQRLVELGVRPLYAQMEQVVDEQTPYDLEYNGRRYRFDRFRRIKQLALEFEELGG